MTQEQPKPSLKLAIKNFKIPTVKQRSQNCSTFKAFFGTTTKYNLTQPCEIYFTKKLKFYK